MTKTVAMVSGVSGWVGEKLEETEVLNSTAAQNEC